MIEIEQGRKVFLLLSGDEWVSGVFVELQELAGVEWLVLEIENDKKEKVFRFFNPGFISEIEAAPNAEIMPLNKK